MKKKVILLSVVLSTHLFAQSYNDFENKAKEDAKKAEKQLKKNVSPDKIKNASKDARAAKKAMYAEKEKMAMDMIMANGKGKGKSLHKDYKIAAALLNTIDQFGGSFMSGETARAVKFVTKTLNVYLNGQLEELIIQTIIDEVLPENGKRYFDLCYKKLPIDFSGSAIDICALIPDDPKVNVCDMAFLPDIPGYRKASSEEMRLQDMQEFYNTGATSTNEPTLLELTKKSCEMLKGDYNPTPMEKQTLEDQIMNADPAKAAKFIHLVDNNTYVRQAFNSGILNPASIARIAIDETFEVIEDGKKIRKVRTIRPYEGIIDQSKPINKKVYGFLLEKAKETALAGGTPYDIEFLFKTLAKNPNKINISYANQYERDRAVAAIEKQQREIEDLETIAYAIKDQVVKNIKEEKGVPGELIDKGVYEYKQYINKYINNKIGLYKKKQELKRDNVLKDGIDAYAKKAENPFFYRMAAIKTGSEQMQDDASEIAKIKLEGKSKIRPFEYWLKKEVAKTADWADEMVAAQEALGIKEIDIVKPPESENLKEIAVETTIKLSKMILVKEAEAIQKKMALMTGGSIPD